MANHAFVTSRKVQSPEVIDRLLAELNTRLFKGNLKIDSRPCSDAIHAWDVEYISPVDGQNYCYRSFWLANKRKFEMRHGGGGDFAWWIDNAICNEVAVEYNGTISDEGVEERWKGQPNEYDDMYKFINRMNAHVPAFILTQLQTITVPPEFRK